MNESINPRLLGQLLIEYKIITPAQLETALNEQKSSGGLLGEILLRMNFVQDEDLYLPLLGEQIGVKYLRLKDIQIKKEVLDRLPAQTAYYHQVMPVDYSQNTLTIATNTPRDMYKLDSLSLVTQSKLKTVLASQSDILSCIQRHYGVGAETIEKMLGKTDSQLKAEPVVSNIEEIGTEASIGKFVNQLLLEGFKGRATDIHIEPFENELSVRYRIDGVLNPAKVPDNIHFFKDSISSRIKIMSSLNIAEKRMPQDGRFKVKVGDNELDMRVSCLPTPYGESIGLRILNSSKLYTLEELGLSQDELDKLDNLIKKPHGIIFVTGPTGSGKTTTLYSCLARLNGREKKILTIEDPIEYQLKGVTQVQINPAIQLSFAKVLRSMLRHDPDIMMVGEVRDLETAEIAIQVALTGHLVLSTLHTNDAPSGVIRLVDMGVEPYLISSAVECFIAQRLIRINCPHCKVSKETEASVLKSFDQTEKIMYWEGQGCEKCRFTGFYGREGIYEFLILDEELKELISKRASVIQLRAVAKKKGMKTLREHGWEKIQMGLTTPSEILRVTQDEPAV